MDESKHGCPADADGPLVTLISLEKLTITYDNENGTIRVVTDTNTVFVATETNNPIFTKSKLQSKGIVPPKAHHDTVLDVVWLATKNYCFMVTMQGSILYLGCPTKKYCCSNSYSVPLDHIRNLKHIVVKNRMVECTFEARWRTCLNCVAHGARISSFQNDFVVGFSIGAVEKPQEMGLNPFRVCCTSEFSLSDGTLVSFNEGAWAVHSEFFVARHRSSDVCSSQPTNSVLECFEPCAVRLFVFLVDQPSDIEFTIEHIRLVPQVQQIAHVLFMSKVVCKSMLRSLKWHVHRACFSTPFDRAFSSEELRVIAQFTDAFMLAVFHNLRIGAAVEGIVSLPADVPFCSEPGCIGFSSQKFKIAGSFVPVIEQLVHHDSGRLTLTLFHFDVPIIEKRIEIACRTANLLTFGVLFTPIGPNESGVAYLFPVLGTDVRLDCVPDCDAGLAASFVDNFLTYPNEKGLDFMDCVAGLLQVPAVSTTLRRECFMPTIDEIQRTVPTVVNCEISQSQKLAVLMLLSYATIVASTNYPSKELLNVPMRSNYPPPLIVNMSQPHSNDNSVLAKFGSYFVEPTC